MKWTDINDIAIELTDTYPDKGPAQGQFREPARLGHGPAGIQ